jgi:hypothetical protein
MPSNHICPQPKKFHMKHVCFSLALLFFACFAFSQIDPVKTKPAVSKPATLQTPVSNKPYVKLPDIRVTSATVLATSTGPDAYTLTITCTIKNEGDAPISYADVSVGGRFTEYANSRKDLSSTNFRSGCGSGLGQARDMLLPGASATMQYRCFNVVLLRSNNYEYILLLNEGKENEIKESSTDNNRLDLPIIYQ